MWLYAWINQPYIWNLSFQKQSIGAGIWAQFNYLVFKVHIGIINVSVWSYPEINQMYVKKNKKKNRYLKGMLLLKHKGKTKAEKRVTCCPWCPTHTNIFLCKISQRYFSCLSLWPLPSGKPWQLLLISQSFTGCNLFCHPAWIPAHDPCFTLRLWSSKAEGLSSWVRRDGSSHRAALSFPLFHSDDDRQMQYAECTSIPGLPKNVGVIPDARDNAGHCCLTNSKQKAG